MTAAASSTPDSPRARRGRSRQGDQPASKRGTRGHDRQGTRHGTYRSTPSRGGDVSRRGAADRPCRTGIRRSAPRREGHRRAHPPRHRTDRRAAARLGQRAVPVALPARVRPPRTLLPRLPRQDRLGRAQAAQAVRVLGARGLDAAAQYVPVAALADGCGTPLGVGGLEVAGRAGTASGGLRHELGPRDPGALGGHRGNDAADAGAARPGQRGTRAHHRARTCVRRRRQSGRSTAQGPGGRGRPDVELAGLQDRDRVAVLHRPGHHRDAKGVRADLRPQRTRPPARRLERARTERRGRPAGAAADRGRPPRRRHRETACAATSASPVPSQRS